MQQATLKSVPMEEEEAPKSVEEYLDDFVDWLNQGFTNMQHNLSVARNDVRNLQPLAMAAEAENKNSPILCNYARLSLRVARLELLYAQLEPIYLQAYGQDKPCFNLSDERIIPIWQVFMSGKQWYDIL